MRSKWAHMLCLAALVTTCGCGRSDTRGSSADGRPSEIRSVETVTAAEANALVVEGKAVLVDVREANEIAGGMAAPAVWMPTSRIGSEEWERFVTALPKDRQVIFYCAAGARSQRAALELSSKGYHAANMGGFDRWRRAGLPVKTPESPEVGK